MYDVIGLLIQDEEGTDHCLLTWGRLYSPVDPAPTVTVVRGWLSKFGLAESADRKLRVAATLQQVAHAPMFFECLMDMQLKRFRAMLDDPSLRSSSNWYRHCEEKIESGRFIWYLGDPGNPNYSHET